LRVSQGEIEIGVSVVTIAELVHGADRAETSARQERRLGFIDRLSSDVPVHPVHLLQNLPDRLLLRSERDALRDCAAYWLSRMKTSTGLSAISIRHENCNACRSSSRQAYGASGFTGDQGLIYEARWK